VPTDVFVCRGAASPRTQPLTSHSRLQALYICLRTASSAVCTLECQTGTRDRFAGICHIHDIPLVFCPDDYFVSPLGNGRHSELNLESKEMDFTCQTRQNAMLRGTFHFSLSCYIMNIYRSNANCNIFIPVIRLSINYH